MMPAEFDELAPEELRDLRFEWAAAERRWDERFGVICSTMVNQRRKSGTKPAEPSDFFPWLYREQDEQSENEMIAVILTLPGVVDKRNA